MARWMKVILVALGGIVCLIPTVNQISYAAYYQSLLLPNGEEVTDDDLKEVEGGQVKWLIIAAAVTTALAIPAAYCIVEVMERRIPKWDTCLALLGLGTLVAAVGYYSSVRSGLTKGGGNLLLLDLVGPYSPQPPENAARWRF